MPGFAELGRPVFGNVRRKPATLQVLNGQTFSPEEVFTFQYFPDSIQDQKTINYAQRSPYQSSLPIYQWVNTGSRVVQFTAQFSSDIQFTNRVSFTNTGIAPRDADVNQMLEFLRGLLFPVYDNSSIVAGPPILILNLPGTSIGALGRGPEKDSIYCLMTRCEITIDALFPGGGIRTATVQLGFEQIPQINNSVIFPSRTVTYAGQR